MADDLEDFFQKKDKAKAKAKAKAMGSNTDNVCICNSCCRECKLRRPSLTALVGGEQQHGKREASGNCHARLQPTPCSQRKTASGKILRKRRLQTTAGCALPRCPPGMSTTFFKEVFTTASEPAAAEAAEPEKKAEVVDISSESEEETPGAAAQMSLYLCQPHKYIVRVHCSPNSPRAHRLCPSRTCTIQARCIL